MAGLVPAIHVLSGRSLKDVDARTSPGMTKKAVNSDLAALLLSPAPVPASRVNHQGPARPGFCAGVQVALRLFSSDRKYTVDYGRKMCASPCSAEAPAASISPISGKS